MIVPHYWAEGRVQQSIDGHQITVRRFGWSDVSEADAQSMADERAREAAQRLAAGQTLPKREPKVPYNGAEGVPIREEIVAEHGATIITRNAYGARCLNTPNVLFADIDFEDAAVGAWKWIVPLLLLGAAVGAWALQSTLALLVFGFIALVVGWQLAKRLARWRTNRTGGPEAVAMNRLRRFIEQHQEWHLRVYRTPSGLRALAMHRTFDPNEPAVAECFKAVHADRVYVRMCLRQHCFRARLTAKPWRIGIEEHLRPRPGVWPVNPERLPERRRWVESYEAKAQEHAACRFIEALGSEVVEAEAEEVRRLHDEESRALSSLPLA